MKVQFVTKPDAAGFVRAHVELSKDEAIPLKYKEKDYTEERALKDAEAYVVARAKAQADEAAKVALESSLSYKLDKLTEEFGAAAVKAAVGVKEIA
jgi:hypothetical protein